MIWDLIVAGGGPAGLATAIAARRAGMSVLVIEPREGPIDKACGEGLMPGGVGVFRSLGVELEGEALCGITYVDAIDPQRTASGTWAQGRGLGVRRTTLSARLQDRAREVGVAFEHGRVATFDNGDASIRVGNHVARYLVGADGARSQIRAAIGAFSAQRRSQRLGVRVHYRLAPWTDCVEVHLASKAEAYVTPVGPSLVGVALLFEPPGTWASTLAAFPRLRERLDSREPIGRMRGAGPLEQRARFRTARSTLLVGDAAGYLDALTGEGIALGVLTGLAAVDAMNASSTHAYEKAYRSITQKHVWATRALLALLATPLTRRGILSVGQRVPLAFDAALSLLDALPNGYASPRLRPGVSRHRAMQLG